jgi:hypothetical protein
MPRVMHDNITLSERSFYASDTLTRTCHAVMDQRLHASLPFPDSKSTTDIVAECQQQYTVLLDSRHNNLVGFVLNASYCEYVRGFIVSEADNRHSFRSHI